MKLFSLLFLLLISCFKIHAIIVPPPIYQVQGKNLDMVHIESIVKCGVPNTFIPLTMDILYDMMLESSGEITPNTTYPPPCVGYTEYQLTIYNSTLTFTQGTAYYSGLWTANLPSYLDAILASAVSGNYYIIKLSARNSCSPATTASTSGHFQYFKPITPTAGFNVSGSAVPATCSIPRDITVCSSTSFTLNNLSNSSAMEFQIEILSSPTACGTYVPVYSSGYLSSFPTDLLNLPGTGGTWLQTHAGYFQVRLTTKNLCGESSSTQSGYLRVVNYSLASLDIMTKTRPHKDQTITINSCVVPQSTQFNYNYADTVTTCGGAPGYNFNMQHYNYLSANEIGRSARIYIETKGLFERNYTVIIFVDKWTGSTWQPMNYADPITGIIAGDISYNTTVIAYKELLDDNISNPYYGAFKNPLLTPDGTIMRITTNIMNGCDSFMNVEYIKMNTVKLK